MAEMIFKDGVFFKGSDNYDQLIQILSVLGEDDLNAYVKRYNLRIPKKAKKMIKSSFEKQELSSFVDDNNSDLATDDALDLLEKMLVYDKNKRI